MASGLYFTLIFCLSGLGIVAGVEPGVSVQLNLDLFSGDDEDCPCRWTGFKGRCFLFVDKDMAWIDAESYCLEKRGNLASFHSPEEYKFIRTLIRKKSGSNKTSWVGGNDSVKDGVWMWTDGSKFDFINWASGEPNNYHGEQEDCMDINLGGQDYVNDEKCTTELPFVCSKRVASS